MLSFPGDDLLSVHDINAYHGKGDKKFILIFQKIRDAFMKARARYYRSFIPNSIKTPRILNVGCAEGRLLNAFLRYGGRCWGIEVPYYSSQRFLKPNRIVYLKGDVQTLPMIEGAFDLFLWHSLEHIDDPQLVMQRVRELLAPEGLLILAVPNL